MNVPQAEFIPPTRTALAPPSFLARLFDNRHFLGVLFMVPAAALLLLFLTYPLGLGVFLGFTDAKVGRPGEWIGIENYEFLVTDSVFRLSVWNTFLYTFIASAAKFVLGLWLALLLNEHIPFKAFIRAIVLLPFIVPTVLSAIAFWWIYDAQFSIVSWVLTRLGVIHSYIDFLGDPVLARMSVIIANIWRGVPFIAICLLAGLQTISPSLYEAAAIDGASPFQKILARDFADALTDHCGGDDLLGALHLHRLSADLGVDARRTDQCHAFDGYAVVSARDSGRRAGGGRRDRHGDDPVPARRDPLQLFRAAAPALAAGHQRLMTRQ
jgi:multiple sugar transport system permease protein